MCIRLQDDILNFRCTLRISHNFNCKKHTTILGQRYFVLEVLGQFGFREVMLSTLEVLSVAFVCVSDFILHIA
jgi:hypothetical protein